ncbi:MAG: DEAD/DEAH box helicase [Bifidobacteriaceae bacterium]|nr:DEAD/DEAH box helicase [Bifidobacteriaceae bacterium]
MTQSQNDSELELQSKMLTDIRSGLLRTDDTAPGTYTPRLISNQHGSTMGDELRAELRDADRFDMSVAFVSENALKGMYQTFLDAKGGTIVTSTKNDFNSPAAFRELRKLQQYAHVDVRVWQDPGTGFHPKGYVFTHGDVSNLYVGSSNLTCSALGTQREWNLRVSATDESELLAQVHSELDAQLNESVELTDDWIEEYERDFVRIERIQRQAKQEQPKQIVPNSMQEAALANLAKLRADGERRAIVISATGTGKTILSALDVRACAPRRMLYVANRKEILKAARSSYMRVLGGDENNFGMVTGDSKQLDAKYVFASVDTLCADGNRVLQSLNPDDFDYVLMDEVHHAGAKRYQEVMEWFDGVDFMLGMTATPERTDGINIFELFDYNVAYEIRLQQALDADQLCPFHYYGITEYLESDNARIEVGDERQSADGQLVYEIGQLASAERVRYMIDVLQKYGSYDLPVKGIVFCSRVEEAQQLSDLFNQQQNQQAERPYRTKAVSGKTPAKEREQDIDDLENGDLDYLFTVDLFNEGIDIPAVNQIVMLRNTESSIVFTQQLGRGLRKFPGKTCVTVIDFIGNYANNWLIPVALYGNAGDRDMARKNLQRESIGLSSVSFDEQSRERVLQSLDHANWSDMKRLGNHYANMRYELGRIPMLRDVHMSDPSLVMTMAMAKKTASGSDVAAGNYLAFVEAMEKRMGKGAFKNDTSKLDTLQPIDERENGILKMATEILLPGLRPHELVILDELLSKKQPLSIEALQKALAERFPQAYLADDQFQPALRVLDYSFFDANTRSRFGDTPLIKDSDGVVALGDEFERLLDSNVTFAEFFRDCVETGLLMCMDLLHEWELTGRSMDSERGLVYGAKYKIAEVERLLCWHDQVNAQNVGGYKRDNGTGTMPIFIKYAASQYEDQFLNPQELRWFSKNGRTPDSPEFKWLDTDLPATSDAWRGGHFVPLFVMRREESSDAKYYYVGHVVDFSEPRLMPRKEDNGNTVNVTRTDLRLDASIDVELFRHLTGQHA